jgi:polar amino acid transport system permease protein
MGDFWHYLTLGYLYEGARITLEVSALSLVGAVLLGTGIAECRLSRFAPVRGAAAFYTWVIRGTPLLLQLLLLFDALPSIGIVIKPIPTAVIGFTLNEGAFFGEIIRGGISSVGKNQLLAAESLGMSPRVTRRRIVLPQAIRAILPSLGNEFIALIKGTSLASVISISELTQRSQFIASQSFVFFPVFTAAAIIYLAMTSLVALGQWGLERHFSLEHVASPHGVSEMQRWFGFGSASKAARASGPSAVRPSDQPDQPHPAGPVAAGPVAAGPVVATAPGSIAAGENGPNGAGPAGEPLVGVASRTAPSAADRSFVSCAEVHKHFRHQHVLRGIDLEVARGEVVSVMGSSGSGKSTLLRLINHLEVLDEGRITVGGRRIGYDDAGAPFRSQRQLAASRADAHIGMVFQHFNLFEHLTALENVTAAPVFVHGADPGATRARGMDLLDQVGLAAHADKRPHKLSGGQQQRVAIARALAVEPQLMLFDEPTSALDPELVGDVLAAIRRLADGGMTMIVVSHEVRFALDVADRIVFVDQGRVVEQGPPAEVLRHPQEPQTKRFLQSIPSIA